MADENAHSASEDEDESSTSDNDDDNSEPSVELLVTGRTKRAGAGSRIQKLIEQEEDELAEYIKKNADDVDSEEDIDFVGDEDEAISDAELDSSSDDEDQGPSKVDDDLEGEKQLRKQERAEKQRKRKTQAGFQAPSTVRKKTRVDANAALPSILPTTPAPKPKPKKKADRVSWIPNVDEGAVRSSSRKQTVKNKETIHLRMAEKEKQRLKQTKHMEEAERKRRAAKAPPMTQAERMAEAARVERKNAKSLNRWEESERKRAELQKAKLEALHTRQLQGPVITWWSGLARWVNGRLSQVGIREIRDAEKHAEARKAGHTSNDHTGNGPVGNGHTSNDHMRTGHTGNDHTSNGAPHSHPANGFSPLENPVGFTVMQTQPNPVFQDAVEPPPLEHIDPPIHPGFEPTQGLGLLDGIHYYASLPPQTDISNGTDHGHPPPSTEEQYPLESQDQMGPDPIEHPAAFVEKATSPIRPEPVLVIPPQPPLGPMIELASRSLVALRNIDNSVMNIPELQNSVLLKKRNNKLQSEYYNEATKATISS